MIKKYEEFVSKLQTATDERKIVWEKASGKDEFQAVIGNNSVSIKYHPKQDFPISLDDSEGYVSLLLWNCKGENIDEVRIEIGNPDYIVLYNLYASARRAIMKVDETIDEMMADLDKGKLK